MASRSALRDRGEAVHTAIVPREEHAGVDPAELIGFCREHPGYKRTRSIGRDRRVA